MTIRPAVVADAAALAHVHVDTWRHTYAGLVAAAYLDALSVEAETRAWQGWLTLGPACCRYHVVCGADARIEGFVGAGADRRCDTWDSELFCLYVHPRAQGRGLGRALMARVARDALAHGQRSMRCWVIDGNSAAVRFYVGLGARPQSPSVFLLGRQVLGEQAYGWIDTGTLAARAAGADNT